MFADTAVVVLAAGKGTRMRSERPKVLHEVLGRPLVHFPVRLAMELGASSVVVVVGYGRTEVERSVRALMPAACFALQAEQRGTGDAVLSAGEATRAAREVLVLSGDVARLRKETVLALAAARREAGAPVAAVGFRPPDPSGYGRMLLDSAGRLLRIVEHRDATPEERALSLCNAGIYLADRGFLFEALSRVGTDNSQGEVYLTDVARLAAEAGSPSPVVVADASEVEGVNDRAQLASTAAALRDERNLELMLSGVTLLAPERTLVELDVQLGRDVVIHPDVTLRGSTSVADGVTIGQGCVVSDSIVAEGARIEPYCVLEECRLGPCAVAGPFARLRPGTVLEAHAKVGNFVETKKTVLGQGSKANHLTYLGDCVVGRDTNVGAGTITCNYDGVEKHRTVLGDRVFVGSNTAIVAPVEVGDDAVIGAGTTVTQDVPAGSLAVSRVRQSNMPGWSHLRGPAARKRARARAQGKTEEER